MKFLSDDTKCKCETCQKDPNAPRSESLILDLVNDIAGGYNITINCWRRCEAHNAAVGGAPDSQHLHGLACDIACSDSALMYKLVYRAMYLGAKFIEVAPLHLHIDMRAGDKRLITGTG